MIVRVKWLTFQTSELKVSVAKLRLLLTCVFVIIPFFQLYQNGTCECFFFNFPFEDHFVNFHNLLIKNLRVVRRTFKTHTRSGVGVRG